MKKALLLILLIATGFNSFGWFAPDGPQREIYIAKVGSIDTIVGTFNLTNPVCVDWGTNGYPLQVIVNITDPTNQAVVYPITQLWLQYAIGTNASAANWQTIKRVTAKDNVNLNKRGAHFGFAWTPSTPTNYLIRLFIEIDGGFNASTNENDITATGGITWEDWEVVGVNIRNNTIPGYRQ